MNTRKIPALIMLLAGSVACIVTYLNHYSLKDMLIVLFIVLIVFLIIGMIVKGIFDSIHLPTADAVNPDGEVIEKREEENAEAEAEAGEAEAEAGESSEPEQTEEAQ